MNRKTLVPLVVLLVLALATGARAAATWTEYTGNPILGEAASGSWPQAYYPSVLYDASSFSGHGASAPYKMWYDARNATTRLATSSDGINWTDQDAVSLGNVHHATVEYYSSGFSGANNGSNPSSSTMYYRLWYWDGSLSYSISDLRYAESADGLTWYNDQVLQQSSVTPLISSASLAWNRGSYGPCDILYDPTAANSGTDWTFTMYYDGTTGGLERIGLAFSSDGITWIGYDDSDADTDADPVFEGTFVSGDGDYNFVSRATIIKNADDDYEMWYSGGNGTMNQGIGYATSTDGITWTRGDRIFYYADPSVPAWRASRTYTPMVIRDGNDYHMWYAGVNSSSQYSIGYATGAGPTAVTLADFSAGIDDAGVALSWSTASELDVAGFNLYRSERADGGFSRINPDFIPSQAPGALTGADYVWTDRTARPGQVYFYQLEAVNTGGPGTFFGPIACQAPALSPRSIFLPFVRK